MCLCLRKKRHIEKRKMSANKSMCSKRTTWIVKTLFVYVCSFRFASVHSTNVCQRFDVENHRATLSLCFSYVCICHLPCIQIVQQTHWHFVAIFSGVQCLPNQSVGLCSVFSVSAMLQSSFVYSVISFNIVSGFNLRNHNNLHIPPGPPPIFQLIISYVCVRESVRALCVRYVCLFYLLSVDVCSLMLSLIAAENIYTIFCCCHS